MSPNNRKSRRQFSADTKLQILKEGRHTNLSINQVCEQYQISPTLFYHWERQADQAALKALNGQARGRRKSARPKSSYWPKSNVCKPSSRSSAPRICN